MTTVIVVVSIIVYLVVAGAVARSVSWYEPDNVDSIFAAGFCGLIWPITILWLIGARFAEKKLKEKP